MTTKQINERRARIYALMNDMKKDVEREGRTMTQEEEERWNKLDGEFADLDKELVRRQRLDEIEKTFDEVQEEAEIRAASPKATPEERYEALFYDYIRRGKPIDSEEVRKLNEEFRAGNNTTTVLAATDSSTTYGSYLVPITLWNSIERTMKDFSGMLRASRILPTPNGGTLNYPTNDDTTSTGAWLAEPRASALTIENPIFSRKQYSAYTWGTLGKVSLEFMQDEFVGLLPGVLAEMFGERAGRALNKAFTDGDGSGKPTGILDSSNGATTGKTSTANNAITKDEIIDLFHSVDPAYRDNANVAFMFNDSTMAYIRKLDTSTDVAPIWQPSFATNVPPTLLGKPYVINNHFPSLAAGADIIAFGDWSKFIIREVQRPSMAVLSERYMDELARGYVMWCRYDSKLLNTSAIKLLTVNT